MILGLKCKQKVGSGEKKVSFAALRMTRGSFIRLSSWAQRRSHPECSKWKIRGM